MSRPNDFFQMTNPLPEEESTQLRFERRGDGALKETKRQKRRSALDRFAILWYKKHCSIFERKSTENLQEKANWYLKSI
jgi:hypothetical protein